MILVRYGELALKGNNRRLFENTLLDNMRSALKGFGKVRMDRVQGRVAVVPERRVEAAARRLQDVFGISSLSPAWSAEPTPEAIVEVARGVLRRAVLALPTDREVSFRVRTRRAEKTFPMSSAVFDAWLADRTLAEHPHLRVQLGGPELTLEVDIRRERAYVFAERLTGLGGLPVTTQGRVLCLMSGGIDSPVAAWMMMKRGCRVEYVTFHSRPFIGESARKKVVDLVRALARYQPKSVLTVVPFAELQVAVRDAGSEAYRTVIYRRMMHRIATRLALRRHAKALVTGESLGQVASQTMENLTCIGAAAQLPVLRPLIGFDKQETIELARRIGTYEISKVQEPDCCTLFMPARPIIRGRLEDCEQVEADLDVDGLVGAALSGAETFEVEWDA